MTTTMAADAGDDALDDECRERLAAFCRDLAYLGLQLGGDSQRHHRRAEVLAGGLTGAGHAGDATHGQRGLDTKRGRE